ncbi:YdcF family protein [Actinophytocola sp.]|uniref:YdcF family protein n=1 Tax=Actinophytocola sp. TaxID=1872138 RepID=UPI00389A6B9A
MCQSSSPAAFTQPAASRGRTASSSPTEEEPCPTPSPQPSATTWRAVELPPARPRAAPTDVGIGLGSHDIGVAVRTAELYHQGLFPLIVSPVPTPRPRSTASPAVKLCTTRERALEEGVPDEAIRVEPKARNTGENMTLTRELLTAEGLTKVGHADIASIPGAPSVRDMPEAVARGRPGVHLPGNRP